jgi:hypothetical protein
MFPATQRKKYDGGFDGRANTSGKSTRVTLSWTAAMMGKDQHFGFGGCNFIKEII